MLVYPVPHAVTQARVQLVVDQTAKAPPHIINADVLTVFAEKSEAERQALEALKAAQVNKGPVNEGPVNEGPATEDHVDMKA